MCSTQKMSKHSSAFYTQVVELEPERLEEFRNGRTVSLRSASIGDTVIDLAPRKMWEGAQRRMSGRPNLNHFCLTLEKPEWGRVTRTFAGARRRCRRTTPALGAHGNGTSGIFMIPKAMRSRRGTKGSKITLNPSSHDKTRGGDKHADPFRSTIKEYRCGEAELVDGRIYAQPVAFWMRDEFRLLTCMR